MIIGSANELIETRFFRKTMQSEMFILILKFLHFTNNSNSIIDSLNYMTNYVR